MTAKEYLSQAFRLDQEINSRLEQIMRLRESITKATATLSDMPRSESPNPRIMESTIAKIVDLESEINGEIDRLIDLKREVRTAISKLSDPEQRLVLELRYLCYKSWTDIAEKLGHGDSNVYRLHGLAINNLKLPERLE